MKKALFLCRQSALFRQKIPVPLLGLGDRVVPADCVRPLFLVVLTFQEGREDL